MVTDARPIWSITKPTLLEFGIGGIRMRDAAFVLVHSIYELISYIRDLYVGQVYCNTCFDRVFGDFT